MPGKITVLGTHHEIQGLENRQTPNVDDPDYAKLIRNLTRGESIDLLFEEAAGLGPSVASKMMPDRYVDVDPSAAERVRLGIDVAEDSEPVDHWNSKEMLHRHKLEGQERREQFWLEKIKNEKFDRGLLICGMNHLLSMSFRLRAEGFEVAATYYDPRGKICDGLREQGFEL